MLGSKSTHAQECYQGNFIGVDFGIHQDLSNDLPDNWREFNKKFIPVYLEKFPEKSKVAAGLSCGALWTVSKGLDQGDVVLCPNGQKEYYVGEIASDYYYKEGEILPHRRKVKWYHVIIDREAMSGALKNSTGSIGTVSDISGYSEEIETLILGHRPPTIISTDSSIEDPSVFAMEKHLEEFLAQNWKNTELGKRYKIYEEDGELLGKQYQTDVGIIDILAISKDKKTFLVVELKRGRVSDMVVGQTLRYMGYVKDMVAEPDQEIKGVIIGLEDDLKLRRALSVSPNIEFYKYKIDFKLFRS